MFTSPFELSSFRRVNTVNPALPWNTPGQSGDVRIYANADGFIALNSNPVLYLENLVFEITTPYPNEAQIRALSPLFASWVGDIGTGAPQIGFGYGDVNVALSNPAWAALFASSDYKVSMPMIGISSEMAVDRSWFDFTLNFDTGDPVQGMGTGQSFDLTSLPTSLDFNPQNMDVTINSGTNPNARTNNNYFFVKEIDVTPTGALPGGLNSQVKSYWSIATTLQTFNVDLIFTIDDPMHDFSGAKANTDWVVLSRTGGGAWSTYPTFVTEGTNSIKATGVTQAWIDYEFTIASTIDETLPVELSSFAAVVNSDNQIAISWSTASETSMIGYLVYYRPAGTEDPMYCLTPVAITASNDSQGSSYSFVASELSQAGTYNFWLEAISQDGSSSFYGPVSATLNENVTPPLPGRNYLGNAYPNPFRSGDSASFRVDLKDSETGKVEIYNLSGQLVKAYQLNPGSHDLIWNGTDTNGNLCASGIYFYRLSSPSLNQTKRMVVLK